jgi:hypothetical protein
MCIQLDSVRREKIISKFFTFLLLSERGLKISADWREILAQDLVG